MKTITIITEQVTDRVLTAAVPPRGVASVSISANRSGVEDIDAATYRSFRNPDRFKANYRIEMVLRTTRWRQSSMPSPSPTEWVCSATPRCGSTRPRWRWSPEGTAD